MLEHSAATCHNAPELRNVYTTPHSIMGARFLKLSDLGVIKTQSSRWAEARKGSSIVVALDLAPDIAPVLDPQPRRQSQVIDFPGAPYGNRTRVSALRGRGRPWWHQMSVGGPNALRAIRTTKGFATKPKPLFGGKSRNSDCTARLDQSRRTR
jgi:hypothetical protein